jgi:hypothetical protein
MKRIVFVFLMLLSFNCFAEPIVGNITESQREADKRAYFERLKKSEELVNAEIMRKHQLNIEVAKFNNALILERAGASNINVSSYSSNRTETKTLQNTGTIKA